jgi:hypothetical protein
MVPYYVLIVMLRISSKSISLNLIYHMCQVVVFPEPHRLDAFLTPVRKGKMYAPAAPVLEKLAALCGFSFATLGIQRYFRILNVGIYESISVSVSNGENPR